MRSFSCLSFICSFFSLARATAIAGSNGGRPLSSTQTQHKRQQDNCQPFYSTFSESDVSQDYYTPFVGVSHPDTYTVTENGLEMFLKRPQGTIARQGHVNSEVAEGATINSTFATLYGKVTFGIEAPQVAGVVTAAILISEEHDEIDVELLGGDPHHWQTNVYAPSPRDTQPLWGVFGQIENFGSSPSTVSTFHNYSIDWNEDRIVWSVDGHEVRILKPSQTRINGTEHYPTQASRIQLGIWDASSPEGTSEWARGPINWQTTSSTISATVKSIRIECD